MQRTDTLQKGSPAKLIYTVCSIFILAAIPARFMQWNNETYYRDFEESLLVIAIPGMWFYLMFFAGSGS